MKEGTVENRDEERYIVVLNHEEQYSIWLEGRQVPDGWRPEGKSGSKEECLAHIETVWTDMRPLSLRLRMESAEV
ncbi:MbtH family NRPS accessory protein (plasmid) [Streptomyces cynarae]|uniref:MbtH family NRPS accessory protein n=1 Tax=Streptomyces cynarae TaxID=2981134 RepID=A0ABY6EEG6_9ACTN|nr:MbtH family NRPS accessory protein [Streptomyces cynarae]UXY25102.1 MbtH family NRPS accessory protein [Streptomyces cynarae]